MLFRSAGTMNSSTPCIVAASATLDVLEQDRVHERLFVLGKRLMEGLRLAGEEAGFPILVQGLGPMFHVGFTALPQVSDFRDTLSYDKARYARFVLGMQERGIRLIGRGLWYLSAAHTEADIDYALMVAKEVLKEIAE